LPDLVDNLYFILYPSGSHGNFLKLLLNTIVGNSADNVNTSVYDSVTYWAPCTFDAGHAMSNVVDQSQVINIQVNPASYLKYFAMCLNRTSDNNILVENLSTDTFDKIKQHSIISYFASSLSTISGKVNGHVDPKYLREWFRLCFFANNGDTITKFILPSTLVQSKYIVDFESFYNGTILDRCREICNNLKLSISNHDQLEKYMTHFVANNTYYTIDQNMPDIISAIDQGKLFDISSTNILQQAWIDNYLVTKYNINPFLRNKYFSNTQELVKAYGI